MYDVMSLIVDQVLCHSQFQGGSPDILPQQQQHIYPHPMSEYTRSSHLGQ